MDDGGYIGNRTGWSIRAALTARFLLIKLLSPMSHRLPFIILCLFVAVAACQAPPAATPSPASPEPVASPAVSPAAHLPQPYLEYQIYGGKVIVEPQLPPVLPNGQADYNWIYARYDLCRLIAAGEVDEVWLWTGDGDGVEKGHLYEWVASGPGWNGLAPDCGRVVATHAFNFSREVDVAMESYTHRVEGFLTHYYPCDFVTDTWPWQGGLTWGERCQGLLSDRTGFVARPFSGNGYVAACGDAHHPPNILGGEEYRYDSPAQTLSICPNWSQDGSAQPVRLDCSAWGCTHWGYHVWWLQNLPGLNNANRDAQGRPHANWWEVIVNGKEAAAPNRVAAGASPHPSTAQPGGPQPEAIVQPEAAPIPETGLSPVAFTASLPAIRRPVVFVLAFPGYGQPRASFDLLTAELIELLKQGSTYHGYQQQRLQATFLGQDGASFAGEGCQPGSYPNNVHIRLSGLRPGLQPKRLRVEDPSGGGSWATPCDPVSDWLLHAVYTSAVSADLYFKPFRNASAGSRYTVSVEYENGYREQVSLPGGEVSAFEAAFVGQDGGALAGAGCTLGSPAADNLHLRLRGLKTGLAISRVLVEDPAGGGRWSDPCDPASDWMVVTLAGEGGGLDLFFKPYRAAAEGTLYRVTVEYEDGSQTTAPVPGSAVTEGAR